jgi:hypothetical protein
MIISLGYAAVAEEIFAQAMIDYFVKIGWAGMYPNHPVIRVSNEYPWVPYMDSGWPDLSQVQETIFPAITIVSTSDEKSPREKTVQLSDPRGVTLEKDEYASFLSLVQTNGYMIDPAALTAMETYFETHDFLYGMEIHDQRRDTIHFDIITDDPSNIRNRIYDQTLLFLSGLEQIELFKNKGLTIINSSIGGSRTPEYNVEFGRVLRGSSITVQVDSMIQQTYYDTSAELFGSAIITNIAHTLGE